MYKNFNFKIIIFALLYTTPAVIAFIGLEFSPNFYFFVYERGFEIFWRNFNLLVLTLYLPIFLYGLGLAVKHLFARKIRDLLSNSDLDLILIFSGSGLLVILGSILSFLGFTEKIFNILIFCITIFFVFLNDHRILNRWLTYIKGDTNFDGNIGLKIKRNFSIIFVLNITFIFLSLILLIVRGIHIDFTDWDGFAMYFPYLTEIMRNNGTQMDPDYPHIINFLQGRGRGLYIFFSSITDEAGSQIVSFVYFILIALLGSNLISKILVIQRKFNYGIDAVLIAPAIMRLLVLFPSESLTSLSFVRYHLESGAQSVFLLWIAALIMFCNNPNIKPIFYLTLPTLIALPLALPQHTIFFVLLYIGIIYLSKFVFQKEYYNRILYQSILIGILSCIFSICFNWIYVGIPAIVPYFIFKHFLINDIFSTWIGEIGFNWFHYQHSNIYIDSNIFSKIIEFINGIGNEFLKIISNIFIFSEKRRYLAFIFFIPALFLISKSMKFHLPKIVLAFTLVCTLMVILVDFSKYTKITEIFFVNQIESNLRLLKVFLDTFMITNLFYVTRFAISGSKNVSFRKTYFNIRLGILFIVFFYWVLSKSFLIFFGSGSLSRLLVHSDIFFQIFTICIAVYFIKFLDFSFKHSDKQKNIPWRMIIVIFFVMIFRELWFLNDTGFKNYYQILPIAFGSLGIFFSLIVFENPFSNELKYKFHHFSYSQNSKLIVTFLLIFGFIVNDVAIWTILNRGGREVPGGFKFFVGYNGLNKTQPRFNKTCKMVYKISNILPSSSKIIFMNDPTGFTMCKNMLLPKGKIPDHLDSYLPKYFSKLVLSPIDSSVRTYKELSINYFGFFRDIPFPRKDPMRWPGFSKLFEDQNLNKYFETYYSDSHMIILTWKNNGGDKIHYADRSEISKIREKNFKDYNGNPTSALLALRRLKSNL